MALYGLGSMSNGIKNRSLSAFLLLFYNQVLGLPAAWVGAVIMVALMIDGLIDPTVGLTSDNTRSRWGRRHPFMYASAVPYGLMFCLIWNPPPGLSDHVLLVYMAVCVIGVRVFDTFFEVPASALAPELTRDYDKRNTLISFRYFFGLIGGLSLSLLAYRVFLREDADNPEGLLGRAGYGQYGLVAGAVIVVIILISTLGTHHRIPWLQDPPERKLTFRTLLSEVFATLANRSLWVATASGTFAAIAGGVSGGLAMYFNIYFWELSAVQLSYFVTVGFVASITGVLLGPPLIRRFGKKDGAIVLFAVTAVLNVLPVTLRLLGLLPPNGSPVLLGILLTETFVTGALGLMLNIALTSMIADLAEDSEVRTGRRSEGLLVSADNFLKKATSGAGIFVSSLLLTFAGLSRQVKPGDVPEETLRELGLVYVPVVSVFYVLAIACLFAYRITRETHEQNLVKLRAVSAAAEAEAPPP